LNIGPIALPLHPLIFLLSVAVALAVAQFVSHGEQKLQQALFTSVWVGLLVARLSFVIRYFPDFQDEFLKMFDIRDLGFDFIAGIVGGLCVTARFFFRLPAQPQVAGRRRIVRRAGLGRSKCCRRVLQNARDHSIDSIDESRRRSTNAHERRWPPDGHQSMGVVVWAMPVRNAGSRERSDRPARCPSRVCESRRVGGSCRWVP